MKVDCPHCSQHLEIADEWAGHATDCPNCRKEFTLPTVAAVEVPVREDAPEPPTETAPPPNARRPASGHNTSSKRPRREGGGFGKFLLALILLVGLGFGYAMMHFKESPEQIWQRMVDAVEGTAKPAPPPPAEATPMEPTPAPVAEHTPTLAPTPTPTPDPTPEPAVSPEATPAPTPVDPLVWLLQHKEYTPKLVILQRPATFSISLDGEVVGDETVPAGETVQLLGFTEEAIDARSKNGTGQVPVDATNLREWATKVQAKVEQAKAASRPSTVSPMPQQTPATVRAVAFPKPHFTSPGVIFNHEDLETLKANLQREPWKSGFEALAAEGRSKLEYRMGGPFAEVKRAPNLNLWPWRGDMIAIWNLSRMWYFTGDEAYAQKAHDILLAWATTQTSFGGRESMLDLGDYAICYVGGADILRGTWPGWTRADTAAVKKYFNDVLLPASNPYGENQFGAANKGALALATMGLMAIFNEDSAKLETIVYQARTLAHIGLRSSNGIGMLGDSLRDQGHAHGQLVSLATLAEALWKQGIDIYSDYDNRLLAAGEYFARVNTRTPTPFLPFGTTDAYYTADRTNRGWGGGNVALNLIHGAYVVRKGLPAPYTDRHRQAMPTDGGSFMFIKEVDHSEATPILPLAFPATASITAGFRNTEIGDATPTGSASYSDGIWTVRGGGREIWKANDSCHFTYKAIAGDGAIIAKVESVENNSPSAKAGVMMRTSLDQDAPRAWIALTGGGNLEQNMPNLTVYGGTNYGNKVLAHPFSSYWVKLERIGNVITGYVSPDGTNWAATDVGRIDAPVPTTIYVGLVVCAADNSTLNTSTFSNVQITDGDGGAPVVVPAAPAALLASPADGAVPLRWQSSFGATSYTVKRASSPRGPYTTVASDITASSYTDTAVTNDTTYYYVVTASNSAGTSDHSPVDVVTPRAPKWNVALGGTITSTVGRDGVGGAFDSNSRTMWFAGDYRGEGSIQYDFGAGHTPMITGYTITSPYFKPERDPRDWQFQGSNDGTNWTTLDTQSGQTFPFRFYEVEYTLPRPAAYRYFRLHVTQNNGAETILHIADIKLLSDQPRPNAPMPSLLHWKTNDTTDRNRAIAMQQAAESEK